MILLDSLNLKIASLDQLLKMNNPDYKQELENIRAILQKDPELIQLLPQDQGLNVVFAAMQKFKQVEIPVTIQKESKKIPKGPIGLDSF